MIDRPMMKRSKIYIRSKKEGREGLNLLVGWWMEGLCERSKISKVTSLNKNVSIVIKKEISLNKQNGMGICLIMPS